MCVYDGSKAEKEFPPKWDNKGSLNLTLLIESSIVVFIKGVTAKVHGSNRIKNYNV